MILITFETMNRCSGTQLMNVLLEKFEWQIQKSNKSSNIKLDKIVICKCADQENEKTKKFVQEKKHLCFFLFSSAPAQTFLFF